MNHSTQATMPMLPSTRCGAELQRRHEQAHREAARLRHEALASFWRETSAWLDGAADAADHAARRAGHRFEAALRRHRGKPAARPCA